MATARRDLPEMKPAVFTVADVSCVVPGLPETGALRKVRQRRNTSFRVLDKYLLNRCNIAANYRLQFCLSGWICNFHRLVLRGPSRNT